MCYRGGLELSLNLGLNPKPPLALERHCVNILKALSVDRSSSPPAIQHGRCCTIKVNLLSVFSIDTVLNITEN